MDVSRIIHALEQPGAYPHPVDDIQIRQTHISIVSLAGPFVYKVKKPVDLGFLDFTTLDKRRHFCEEEVRLNRRLAPSVYLGVVPLTESNGFLRVDGDGAPVEYAVKMLRLPQDATLRERLRQGALGPDVLANVGRRIAGFHADAASGPEISEYGGWDVVAGNARENLEQSRDHVGECLSRPVFDRLEAALERTLGELRPLIESRAHRQVPRDTHGDLHLDHIYHFPDKPAPDDLLVIDCIEFNERFRYADPVADVAFLAMDLHANGRYDLAEHLCDTYFRAADDAEGRNLLPFYTSYRAAVRAKVYGMTAHEGEVPQVQREDAVRLARGYWLLALSELEEPEHRPCLILVGGLPGTGKTTLAHQLAASADMHVVSSDRVRKELAGLRPKDRAGADFGEGMYTPEWDDRTYQAALERASELLFEGKRVLVDASFREAKRRRDFFDAAKRWGVRSAFVICTASPETVRRRLATREGDASDADWAIYEAAARVWEPEQDPGWNTFDVPTDREVSSLDAALRHLRASGLVGVDS